MPTISTISKFASNSVVLSNTLDAAYVKQLVDQVREITPGHRKRLYTWLSRNPIIMHGDGIIIYKGVLQNKKTGRLHSTYDSNFTYPSSGVRRIKLINTSPSVNCGRGIHVAPRPWVVENGYFYSAETHPSSYTRSVLLECYVNLADIKCVSTNSLYEVYEKIRVSKVEVLAARTWSGRDCKRVYK